MENMSLRYTQLSNAQGGGMPFKEVRELKSGISIEAAAQLTAQNGLDELFFSTEGKNYVAFAESDTFEKMDLAAVKMTVNGKALNVIKINDEVESNFTAGALDMATTLYRGAIAPLRPVLNLIPNQGTGVALAAGIVTGVVARTGRIYINEFENWTLASAARTGIASGGIIGLATTKHIADRAPESSFKSMQSLAYGAGGVAVGAALPDVIRLGKNLIDKVPEPLLKTSAKVAGIAAVAAVTGGTLAIVGNGIAASNRVPDVNSIDEISQTP